VAPEDTDNVFKARVLAYSTATWKLHASAIKGFLQFCESRELNPFECTPSILNLFMLYAAQNGKSFGVIDSFLSPWSFVTRFLMFGDYTQEKSVHEMKKFTEKACTRQTNKKLPFGAAEVQKIWDKIDHTHGTIENLSLKDLRTFMLAVLQHKTFRRSDLQQITLGDVFHEVDYFKIHFRFTKTDQQGEGQ
jgi:hypothetical protein